MPEMNFSLAKDALSSSQSLKTTLEDGIKATKEIIAEQLDAKSDLQADQADAVNPMAITRRLSMKEREQEIRKIPKTESVLVAIEATEDSANKFNKKNKEFIPEDLIKIRKKIQPGMSKEEILEVVQETYQDPVLIDGCLEFLTETTTEELQAAVNQAREKNGQENQRPITAHQNINTVVGKYSASGAGTPQELRQEYQKLTSQERTALQLFDELSKNHTYEELVVKIKFLHHSLGKDLTASSSSIEPAFLHKLINEVRNLQAITGGYKFEIKRLPLVGSEFDRANLTLPPQLSSDASTKQLFGLCSERYPAAEKVIDCASKLGLRSEESKIIVLQLLFRDAVRELDLNRIFQGDVKKRDAVYSAIIDALTRLEDQLEEREERMAKNTEKAS